MNTNLLMTRLLLLWAFAFSASVWGQQTNIIPVRDDVSGFPTWTDTNVAGSTYLQLLTATSNTVTPAMNFDSFTSETLNFKARTFGGSTAAEIVLTVSISTNNGASYVVLGTRTPASSTLAAQTPFDLSSYNGTQIKLKFSVAGSNNAIGVGIDDIAITGLGVAGPKVTATPTTLSGFTYIQGNGPSAEQSFSVSGSNLTDNITVTSPTNYEISATSGSGFGNSVVLTQSAGNVTLTTVYARLQAGLTVNNSYTGNIGISSTGATAVNIALNGAVTPIPVKPVITAPGAQTGTVGATYNYQIVASESPTSYALASGSLPIGLNLNTTSGVISGTPTKAGSFTATITASNGAGTSAGAAFAFTIAKGTQNVSLPTLDSNTGDAPITLPATTDAGITIVYSTSNASTASISGNTLTINASGTAQITATNAGNADFDPFNATFSVNVTTSPCFNEDFTSITGGNNTSTAGSGTAWAGNPNFPTVDTAYQAGGAVKLGSGNNVGLMTSKVLSQTGGNVKVTFDVKGWTTVEGNIKVTLGLQSQTSTYTAKIADSFENKIVNFTNVPLGSTLKIETTAKRAFVDNVTISCGTITVWNGTEWSNGTGPDATTDALISEDYNGTSLTSQSLTINAGKTLTVNSFVKTGNVTNNGNIIVANNANFLQTGTFTDGPSSTFKVRRDSNPVKRLGYIAWSSPLDGSTQTLKEFSKGKLADGTTVQSPVGTTDTRFFKYNNGTYVVVASPSTATFTPKGQGFQIRTPNDFTTTTQPFHGYFEGTKPNTGAITYDASAITGRFVFLGNPYPSVLDMEAFYVANNQITGTFYIWNSAAEMTGDVYTGTTYNTYNKTGTVPAASAQGYVPIGQGFFVDRGVNAINSFTFTDAMRNTTATGVFAKAAVTDRFWLQMTAPSGAKPQMLIGFSDQATSGYDQSFDAKLFDNNSDVLYSKVENQSLIIDARASFNDAEAINVNANFLSAGNYTINVLQKEGVFNNGQQIYLKDNVTGSITDITANAYNFVATTGTQTNRFTILFKAPTLASSSVIKDKVTIFSTANVVHVKSSKNVKQIEIYDMSGKMIRQIKGNKSENQTVEINYSGVVLVKVTRDNGLITNNKVILKF